MLKESELLTLDDGKKYVVVFSTMYNNENYAFLIDQDDYENTMVCKYDNNDGLEEVTDQSIIEQIMKLYIESKNNK